MKKLLFLLLISLLAGLTFSILAQDEEDEDAPVLQLNVGGVTCDLVIVDSSPEMESTEEPEMQVTEEAEAESEMESTEEPEMDGEEAEHPIITLSEDCENLLSQLRVAQNGTLWIALSVPDEEEWQEFGTSDDESDLQFDRRGRYIGCQNPEEGEQVCSVTWTQGDVTYVIEIPIVVGDAFVAPSLPDTSSPSESSAEPVSSTGDGQWGACGSCSTCGANSNLCVTSPDGQCVADPARCEIRPPESSSSSGGGGGGAPSPATTEEP